VTRLALCAVKALFEYTDLGLEMGDAKIFGCFALLGGLEPGTVKAGLLSSLDEQRTIRAIGATTTSKRLEEVR
jgi:hypothetical protein